ncbi:MAG: AmmeMemoRadiSam system radical SAM enzyme [Candidatus Omnitrophota bacterium]|jgi:pyruvate formate lyase activating enzyme
MAKGDLVQCELCPNGCVLDEGQKGNCRARSNKGGKVISLVYGKPCAVHVDPIEKKPLYHFLPASSAFSIGTAGCNLHCKYCQNWDISQSDPEETDNIDLPPGELARRAAAYNCRSIAYTYNDPVIYLEYVLDTAKIGREAGIKSVFITAGYINPKPLDDLCSAVDAIKVDFKGITEEFYNKVSFGRLRPVLDTIKAIKERKVWMELVNLIVPTLNDKKDDLARLIDWTVENVGADVPLHFSKFWPQYQLKNLPPTPEETLDAAWKMAKKRGVHYAYVGNIPSHDGNNTYCPKCGKLLIKRVGYDVLENNVANGRCASCNEAIPGVWQ